MSSAITDDEQQRWVPTHVQVTVLRARGLRAKGKHGTSDAYVIIQVGKEKYSTCVMEKTTNPEWGEECSFELQPGVLEPGGRDVCPPGSCDLTLTAMHRALIGLDVFLGQTVIPLDKAFQDRISMKKEWHRLHSKTGKKEKERGDVQVTVQFTRHNLTASMYDLSMKDKPRSAFGVIKERIRGKKHLDTEDSASAIIPGGYGALARMRGRLPSDGGGEEYYEDDEGGEARRSKMRNFFLRGRLRKSSDTRSSTSLGSESSESSSRGGSLSPTAGISVVVSDLSNSPSNSSNLTADNSPEHTVAPSPQVSPHKRIDDDEVCEISIVVPQSFTYESLVPETVSPAPLSTTVANGHPVKHASGPRASKPQPQTSAPSRQGARQGVEPAEPKALPLGLAPALGSLQKASAMSLSLQNLSVARRVDEPHLVPGDGRRWSLDKAGEEERAAIAAAIENAGKLEEEERRAAQFKKEATPAVATGDGEAKKPKWGLFSHGRSESAGKMVTTGKGDAASAPSEGKHKGWFGSKDAHTKPSCSVSQGHPGFDSTPDPSHFGPPDLSQFSPPCHTNPFTSPPPPLSNANPFFPLLQCNPFFQEIYADTALTPNLPALTCFCSPAVSISLSDSSHRHDCHITNGTPPDGANGMTPPQPVIVVAKERLHSNPFISDTNGAHHWEPGDAMSQLSMCPEPSVYTNSQIQINTGKDNNTALINTDIFSIQEPSQLSPNVSHTSLPHNFSMEFSEMHKLACPYPQLLVDQMDTLSCFDTGWNKTTLSQMPLGNVSDSSLAGSTPSWIGPLDQSVEMSETPERLTHKSRGLESAVLPLEIGLNTREVDLEMVLSPSPSAEVKERILTLSREPRAFAYREMSSDDTLEPSTIVSESPGQELEHPANDPLPTCLKSSHQEPNGEQDKEKDKKKEVDVEGVSGPAVDEANLVFSYPDTSSKQVISSRLETEVEGFDWENVDSSVGNSVQTLNRAGPKSVSSGNHDLDQSLGAESPFSTSFICIMASSPSEGLIASESRFASESAQLNGSELRSSPMRVLQDMSPEHKHLPTSLCTGKLEALHHNILESPANLLPSVALNSDLNGPFVNTDSDAYVSIGSDVSHTNTNNPFFSLNSVSFCAASHNSSISPGKDLLLAPQSTQLSSVLCESAESECYHTCNSQQRHLSLCSQRSLPYITAKDPLEQLITSYDLAVKNQSLQDPSPKPMQIHNPRVEAVSQLNLLSLSVLTSDQMDLAEPRNVSAPLSLPTNCMIKGTVPNHNLSLLIQKDDFIENITAKEDPSPDILWTSSLTQKALSEQWPSLGSQAACDRVAEPVPNYEFTEGVVPNSDLTQKDMPKSVPLQQVPATKDTEMNPLFGSRGDLISREDEVQDLNAFSVDWTNFERFAVMGNTEENKEMCEAGASILNEGWASASSWLAPVTSEHQNDRNGVPWITFEVEDRQSQADASVVVSDGTPPSSSVSQDLVITHLQPCCPQIDTHSCLGSSQEELVGTCGNLVGSTGKPLQVFPVDMGVSNGDWTNAVATMFAGCQSKPCKMGSIKHGDEAMPGMLTDLRLTFRPDLQSLSPLASSTPAAEHSPLSFPPVAPALAPPSGATAPPTARAMTGASQAVFSQENQQASNQTASPHPVKPLTPPGEERKSDSRSVLEKLKSTIHPGRHQDADKKTLVEGGGSYYHLNHSELVSLLLQREADLQRERAEFERRGVLLEKREAELRKTKVLMRDLEDYIDRLLVRIMDEKPTLLQVRTKLK